MADQSIAELKTCSKCGVSKPHREFSIRNASADGLQHKCKACDSARLAERRKTTKPAREYTIWINMRLRCHNPTAISYKYYGARGISVCDEWRHSFRTFLEDMGPCPDGLTLDRISSDGPYTKSNCRWASYTAQARNRRNNRRLTLNGVTKTLTEWSEDCGLERGSLASRIEVNGFSVETMTAPLRTHPTFLVRGRAMTTGDGEREFGVAQRTIASRLRAGWTPERAFTQDPSEYHHRVRET